MEIKGDDARIDHGDDAKKGWRIEDLEQWTVEQTNESKLAILDEIYKSTEKKIETKIKQTRLNAMNGRQKVKTLVMERMDDIESRVNKEFAGAADMQKQQDVTDINNKALIGDHAKMQNEKMKGRFEVTINKNLEMKKRIQKFGNEPICYYLHKNRNFLQKLEDKRTRATAQDKVMDFRNNFHEIQRKQNRDLWYARQGVDPNDERAVLNAIPFDESSPLENGKKKLSDMMREIRLQAVRIEPTTIDEKDEYEAAQWSKSKLSSPRSVHNKSKDE